MIRLLKKKTIVSVFGFLLVFTEVFGVGSIYASNSSEKNNSQTYQYQRVDGSIDDILKGQKEQSVYEEPREFGNLKNIHSDAYLEKVKVKQDALEIRTIIENNPDTFSGLYYDSENGKMVVQIAKDSDEAREKLLEKTKYKESIEFKKVKYSFSELNSAQNIIREKAPAGSVNALIPDVENNRLIVSLFELNDKNKEYIQTIAGDVDFIDFIPAIKLELMDDETTYGDPYPMGSRISRYFTQDGTRWRGMCTASYPAVDAADRDVLVTAGHCDDIGNTSAWYQADNSSASIGTWDFRTSSSDPQGTDRTSDAGYIRVSNKDPMPYVPYPSADAMTPITGVYVSDLVGDTVYMRGSTSGSLNSGKIKYSGIDVWYGSNGYGYVRSLVFADYSNLQGDSGGTVLTDYAWDSQKQSYTFKLAGTNSATITLSGNNTIADGTYSLYSPIWTTYNDLNLSGLYLIQ